MVVSSDTTICPGQPVTLTAAGAATYSWQPANLVSNTSGASIQASPTATTVFTVVGQVGTCPADKQFITVTVFPVPAVTATPDTTVAAMASVQLLAVATPPGTFIWLWQPPDDLSDPTIANPIASPAQSTLYTVTAIDQNGCAGSATVQVDILPPNIIDSLYFPNAFSPNGDGRNDEWYVPFAADRMVERIEIYNRWGQLIAEGDASLRWDGTVGGQPQPMDTYLFRVLQRDNIGYLRQWEGWMVLMR
jgi:gliding motility-associated-like protein